jgi:rhodanese-related sulfurtransferase
MPPSELRAPVRRWLIMAVIVLGTAVPGLLYWLVLTSAATVTPWQAKTLLRQADAAAVLVDVRSSTDYAQGHLDSAVNWPYEQLVTAAAPQDVPAALRDRTLLLIDDVGWASLGATRHLRRNGVAAARNVRGGIQEWTRSLAHTTGESFDRWRGADGVVGDLPFRQPTLAGQVISVMAFFVVKPIYTLLSLVVVVLLWRETSADLVALRWSMIFFFVCENACALNVLALKETSYVLEYLHSAGMAVCLSFLAFAVLEGVDRRVVGLSTPHQRCAAMGLCGTCVKQAEVPCGLRRLLTMFVPLLIVVACMLPTADWHDAAYNTTVFGEFYPYGHLRVFQMYENWVCAVAAIGCLLAAFVLIQFAGIASLHRAQVALAAGIGPLGFGLLRVLMGGIYSHTQVWFGFWEEMTELLLLAGICFTLWTFRATLLPTWAKLLQVPRWDAGGVAAAERVGTEGDRHAP